MERYYSSADFTVSPKYDAHIHYHTFDDLFVCKAEKANIRLIGVNTDFDIISIDKQFEISQSLHNQYPQSFNFLCAFDASSYASKTFAEDTIEHIKKCMAAGAIGVKIWKNIGMTLKNDDGQYVMIDDPVFAPILSFLEKEKIPLLVHTGEPKNCWLPLESITTPCDKQYFCQNPNFHAFLHPETPSYEQHIMARDRILERYPDLTFVGAHLGSMEWNLDEAAKRLDGFPKFYVDISARFDHIVELTLQNRNQVVDFFQTYHNRILYGSDNIMCPNAGREWIKRFGKCFHKIYMNLLFMNLYRKVKKHWLFFATDEVITNGKIKLKGLQLPKNIVDGIFYENAQLVYFCQQIKHES